MSHWAEINSENKVIRVVKGDNNDPAGDEGYQWLINNLGGIWIQTSYNNKIRKNFAGIGYIYDEQRNAFIPPRIYQSWILDEETCKWVAPIPYPQDGNYYDWNEKTTSWTMIKSEDKINSPVLPPYPNDGNVYKFDIENNSWNLLIEL